MAITKVEGKDKGDIIIYTLSTCGWCKKTKNLLNELEVAFEYIDVDLETSEVQEKIEKMSPMMSYPTIVIGKKVITGFDEKAIRRALK